MSEEQRAQVEEPTAEMREIFGVSFSAAEHFAQMLAEEGELRGLVGPRELPRLWTRHIVNSAAVVPFLPARGSVAYVLTWTSRLLRRWSGARSGSPTSLRSSTWTM